VMDMAGVREGKYFEVSYKFQAQTSLRRLIVYTPRCYQSQCSGITSESGMNETATGTAFAFKSRDRVQLTRGICTVPGSP
jgi:hypothetical protein